MRVRPRSLMLLAFALLLAAASGGRADYIRDEIRINMRTGPGQEFRILRVLKSGDAVTAIARDHDWVNVRTPDGEEGWVPEGYITQELPPSVALPRAESRLGQSRSRIEDLESRLAEHDEAVEELEALRAENAQLKSENVDLVDATRWKSMGMGALIALGGLAVGAMWPRGGSRGRRIKL